MFNDVQLNAIRTAIRANELGNVSPYELSFAKKGASGASFGTFQADTNTNPAARSVLANVLRAAGADDVTAGRIVTALSRRCPDGNPLSPPDAALVKAALAGPGRALVDAMDNALMQTVLDRVQKAVDAAGTRGFTITPVAILDIALWVNMTGAPDMLCKWISGQTVLGVDPPRGPVIRRADVEAYLDKSSFFLMHPKNFDHFKESVAAGARLLPPEM